eukprot:31314-Pelagococcus_subviridis.AAC.44
MRLAKDARGVQVREPGDEVLVSRERLLVLSRHIAQMRRARAPLVLHVPRVPRHSVRPATESTAPRLARQHSYDPLSRGSRTRRVRRRARLERLLRGVSRRVRALYASPRLRRRRRWSAASLDVRQASRTKRFICFVATDRTAGVG